jgi:hypothetical protein
MSVQRSYSQIPPRMKYLRTVINTMWLYPIADINAALATTTYTYTFDGTNIVCPDYTNLRGIYLDIYLQTAVSQPDGSNPGYTLGVGTALEDLGEEIFLKVGTQIWIHWRNMRQLTPQSPSNIPSPGNSPPDTIGYTTVFTSYGLNNPDPPVFDQAYVVRVG